jgi:O-antigen ligase
MPEYLRSLLVILVLAAAFFSFTEKSASATIGRANFIRRRNLWFGLTLAAFLAHNFWVYTFVAILLLLYASRRENNPSSLFFFVLFALPEGLVQIPGMGLINYFFALSHARILALFILLPAFFTLIRNSDVPSFGKTGTDKILTAYILLILILYLRQASVTDTFRQAIYQFLDVFLPYFVISRSLKTLQGFKDALLSLVLAIMLLALFAIFETLKSWLLYSSLVDVLELQSAMTHYLGRDGMLRAVVTAGQSIPLGYLMVVGLGFYLFLQQSLNQKLIRRFGVALLTVGLIAALARGAWVGAAVLLTVFIATGRNPIMRLMSLSLAGILALTLIAMLPGGQKVINLLPFIGTTEKSNIDYRVNLLTNSIIVIQRNPWFGSVNFLETPEMQAMITGGNIIDVVNSYIAITLQNGFVGLGLFVGFFAFVLFGIYRSMRSLTDKGSEVYLLGRTLLGTLLAILVIIFTVSSITVIPIVYWSVAGLGVAYAQMIRKQAAEKVVRLST